MVNGFINLVFLIISLVTLNVIQRPCGAIFEHLWFAAYDFLSASDNTILAFLRPIGHNAAECVIFTESLL